MAAKTNGKKIITGLLICSCIISSIILAATPSYEKSELEHISQIDSLINVQIHQSRIISDQVRVTNIVVDTILTRKEYRIEVPSRFSKTLFHINLQQSLAPFEIQSPAEVYFPSTDMNIYVYDQNTVLRTLRLTTNPELDTVAQINY